ncbi:type 2 periplasmic-binding domain-containing protein [[Mycoplasma] collis]|uniref:hypothetical protein n=1 Tax=[Mycoplasma] collis TaxID=2127 RepID=UPI00051CA20D|nr:hypothetical protein [[Mycoplasma] collis]
MKKIFKFSSLVLASSLPIATFIACSGQSQAEVELQKQVEKLKENIKTDPTVAKLKTDFAGYSTESLSIIGSKNEIDLQSEALIKVFNEHFGTNLTFKQYGGGTNPGTIIETKIAASSGVGDLLMYAIEPRSEFEGRIDKLIDTSPSAILDHQGDVPGTIKIGDKSFLPQVYEYYGVVYNRDLFNEKGVTVYEGKSFDSASDKPSDLTKDQNYDGTIEKEQKLYVFTNDLKESGYRKVISFLKSKGIDKPFYSIAKGGSPTLWPISTHLIAAAISTLSSPNKWDNANEIITPEVIESVEKALKIMGYDQGLATNDVTKGLAELAVGQTALIQGGTFSEPDIKRTNSEVKLGLFPLPIFNKIDQTAMIYRGAAQKWAITILGKDESKLKLAKMFLQFLYKTKTGYEFLSKSFKFISPYGAPEGVTNALNPESLLFSASNYKNDNDKETNVGRWIHDNFPEGFNTDNQVLKEAANAGYSSAHGSYEKVKNEYNKLLNKNKN